MTAVIAVTSLVFVTGLKGWFGAVAPISTKQ